MGEEDSGASFTYGCSWNMYNNACKFAKSQTDDVRKFKLDNKDEVRKIYPCCCGRIYQLC